MNPASNPTPPTGVGPTELPALLTLAILANALGTTTSGARRLVIREGIPHVRLGKRIVVRRADFEGWLEAHPCALRSPRCAAPAASPPSGRATSSTVDGAPACRPPPLAPPGRGSPSLRGAGGGARPVADSPCAPHPQRLYLSTMRHPLDPDSATTLVAWSLSTALLRKIDADGKARGMNRSETLRALVAKPSPGGRRSEPHRRRARGFPAVPAAPAAKVRTHGAGVRECPREGGKYYVRVSLGGKLYERGPFTT